MFSAIFHSIIVYDKSYLKLLILIVSQLEFHLRKPGPQLELSAYFFEIAGFDFLRHKL